MEYKTIAEVLNEVIASIRSSGRGFDDKVTIELSPSDLLTIIAFFLGMPFGGVCPSYLPSYREGIQNGLKDLGSPLFSEKKVKE